MQSSCPLKPLVVSFSARSLSVPACFPVIVSNRAIANFICSRSCCAVLAGGENRTSIVDHCAFDKWIMAVLEQVWPWQIEYLSGVGKPINGRVMLVVSSCILSMMKIGLIGPTAVLLVLQPTINTRRLVIAISCFILFRGIECYQFYWRGCLLHQV